MDLLRSMLLRSLLSLFSQKKKLASLTSRIFFQICGEVQVPSGRLATEISEIYRKVRFSADPHYLIATKLHSERFSAVRQQRKITESFLYL